MLTPGNSSITNHQWDALHRRLRGHLLAAGRDHDVVQRLCDADHDGFDAELRCMVAVASGSQRSSVASGQRSGRERNDEVMHSGGSGSSGRSSKITRTADCSGCSGSTGRWSKITQTAGQGLRTRRPTHRYGSVPLRRCVILAFLPRVHLFCTTCVKLLAYPRLLLR